ncbi:cytochrome P450 1A1-like [Ostrea edulis]|uniref:cytochrome P450 1A1-like n=1 Tax=Ostrea edulis TaxID=37623 RepID=UPI0024AFC86A|nr:cytochrome P450 1A1-like [Ostrea edulis]XP_048742508.2 cytochrome P450 1A1-like [Ostrea edulis]XP_056000403.1 cytochrome P450 1A1-like [Ostrea edulis]XP_056000404.1 cytochrome P450 1A1-like [Ostrea edulis]XP_056000405.1 cytochrome P450 1A1-like [Ostrea edulis]
MGVLDIFSSGNMDTCWFLTITAIVIVVTKALLSRSKSVPGPWGFPIIGHLPLLGKNPLKQFEHYRAIYGDVYKIQLGVWPTVIINGHHTVRKVLGEQSDSFAARPAFNSFKSIENMTTLTFSYFNPRYLLHRKIASSVVREYATKHSKKMEEILQDEVDVIVNEFIRQNGKPFDPHKTVLEATGSFIYQFCYGKGENVRDDDDFLKYIKDFNDFEEIAKAGNPTDLLPWMGFLFQKKIQKFNKLIKDATKSRKKKIGELLETFDLKHIRHAVDLLMSKIIKYELGDEPNEIGLTKNDVLGVVGDYSGAGFDTSAKAFLWLLLYMAEYPEVQTKIQEEIEEKIGNRRVTANDREQMPWTEATIIESMRLAGVSPLGLPHCATEDVFVNGYMIKKGTVVLFNYYSVGHDKQWDDTFKFKPERFLDSEGKLNKSKIESVLSFSAGRRRCPGEVLARNELFLLLASVLHKCQIRKPQQEEYDLEGVFGATYSPKPYNICVLSREF